MGKKYKNIEQRRKTYEKEYAARREKYNTNGAFRQREIARSTKRLSEKRQRHKVRLTTIKKTLGGVCVYCGIDDLRILQFDHRRYHNSLPKRENITSMQDFDDETIMEEASKCRLLCSNCHDLHTWHSLTIVEPRPLINEIKFE